MFELYSNLLPIDGKRNQGNISGSFNSHGHLPLMFCAIPEDPAGNNFPSLGHQVFQRFYVFVVDEFDFIDAKSADLFLLKPTFFLFFLHQFIPL